MTRHRYDNRLALGVLTRLDRLASRIGDPLPQSEMPSSPDDPAEATHAIAADFAAFLDLVEREGSAADVRAFVAAAIDRRQSQLSQLREAAAAEKPDRPPYWAADGVWRTTLPPPPRFRGRENGDYGDPDYWRALSREEAAAADREVEIYMTATRAEGERRRAAIFDTPDGVALPFAEPAPAPPAG